LRCVVAQWPKPRPPTGRTSTVSYPCKYFYLFCQDHLARLGERIWHPPCAPLRRTSAGRDVGRLGQSEACPSASECLTLRSPTVTHGLTPRPFRPRAHSGRCCNDVARLPRDPRAMDQGILVMGGSCSAPAAPGRLRLHPKSNGEPIGRLTPAPARLPASRGLWKPRRLRQSAQRTQGRLRPRAQHDGGFSKASHE